MLSGGTAGPRTTCPGGKSYTGGTAYPQTLPLKPSVIILITITPVSQPLDLFRGR